MLPRHLRRKVFKQRLIFESLALQFEDFLDCTRRGTECGLYPFHGENTRPLGRGSIQFNSIRELFMYAFSKLNHLCVAAFASTTFQYILCYSIRLTFSYSKMNIQGEILNSFYFCHRTDIPFGSALTQLH